MALRGIRFCKECANILYAKEQKDPDGDERYLIYSCRICDYTERAMKAEDNLVYHRQVRRLAEHVATDYKDFPLDPTLARSTEWPCPKCNYPVSVYFHSEAEGGGMGLMFVCANRTEGGVCGNTWVK